MFLVINKICERIYTNQCADLEDTKFNELRASKN